jgi:hypothetical protein
VPSAEVAHLVRQDPAGLFELMREAIGGAQAGLTLGVSADGYVTSDGRSRLVIARPKRPPYDAEFSRALDARLTAIAASVSATTAAEWRGDHDDSQPPMRVEFAAWPSHRGGNRS